MTTAPAVTAFIGIGSNLGDRLATVEAAVWALHGSDGIAVEDVSGIYETLPWGGVEQDPFLNAVVKVVTRLSARDLLAECHATEAAFGRDRDSEQRWGPRVLDLDVLLYGDEQIDADDLVVPHPRLAERAFVLVPLLEVFPGGELPDGRRLTRCLADLAPIEGIDLFVRMEESPGRQRPQRPAGPAGPKAVPADQWVRPRGAPPGTER